MTHNVARRVFALAVLCLAVVTAVPVAALASTARVKVYADVAGWAGPAVKPSSIAAEPSSSGIPAVTRIRWARWGSASAWGTGKYAPGGQAVTVVLYGNRTHKGTKYFWVMTWKRNGHVRYKWKYRHVSGAPFNPEWVQACFPLTNSGKCYEPGEFCRNSDHGLFGHAGDGESIKCENKNGWRWEPV
jgi:hypothetical protein